MKELWLYVVRWWLIIIVAGIVFYIVYPKYQCIKPSESGPYVYRYNTITGKVQIGWLGGDWREIGITPSNDKEKIK